MVDETGSTNANLACPCRRRRKSVAAGTGRLVLAASDHLQLALLGVGADNAPADVCGLAQVATWWSARMGSSGPGRSGSEGWGDYVTCDSGQIRTQLLNNPLWQLVGATVTGLTWET